MAYEKDILESLFEAIISDDALAFECVITARHNYLKVSYGRFPVLSLAYLFSSVKIIRKYETQLIGFADYERVDERYEAYAAFKKKAKRALRLYLDEDSIVSPVEMLAALKEYDYLKKRYSAFAKDDKIVANLSVLGALAHSQRITADETQVSTPRERVNTRTLKSIVCAVVIAVLVVAVAATFLGLNVSLLGEGNAQNPYRVYNTTQLETAMNSADGHFALAADLIVDFTVADLAVTLDGNGHTLTFANRVNTPWIELLSGTLKNVSIKCEAGLQTNLISSVSGNVVNVDFDFGNFELALSDSLGLAVGNNRGRIEQSTVRAEVNVSEAVRKDLYFSTLVLDNSGIISDCSAVATISVVGDGGTQYDDGAEISNNAAVSAIAAINGGTVSKCTFEDGSSVTADTVDIGGIVADNLQTGLIEYCSNYANLEQTATSASWSPNVGGVVQNNYGAVYGAANFGSVSVQSTAQEITAVYGGGIAAQSTGSINKSKNEGAVSVSGQCAYAYAGGIAAISGYTTTSVGGINYCGNFGKIVAGSVEETYVTAESAIYSAYAAVGGVVGYSSGGYLESSRQYVLASLKDCFNAGEVAIASGSQTANNYVGGVSGAIYVYSSFLGNNVNCGNCFYVAQSGVSGLGLSGYTDVSGITASVESIEALKATSVYWEDIEYATV